LLKLPQVSVPQPIPLAEQLSVRDVIWKVRHLDLLGQIIILLTGAFGVAVLFKESKK